MPFLEVQNVSKGYGPAGQRTEVLSNINLAIEEGEFVAIVGYSGAGKTTLMSLLAGLQAPDTGTVKLEGREMDGPGPDRGLVFQNYSLLPWLTVFENVKLAVDQVFGDWPEEKRIKHTEAAVATVNLTKARDKRPVELSGGMRQRVSVARTLAMKPKILLLDEPLSALDALTRATLQDEIARIWQEQRTTVVLITNDPDEAILLADRVIPLTRGPNATLAPSIPITLPRPRNRRTINENDDFKKLRNQVIESLLSAGTRSMTTLIRNLVLPDIEPEDISVPHLWFGKRAPTRKREKQLETVEIAS
jgi:nitrate/nitrite transport system ATP-binding protein